MRRTIFAAATSALLVLATAVTASSTQNITSQGAYTATGVASAAKRSVPVDQRYPMPATGFVTIVGHGYGHGHGMSQYGAEGAARQGLTWQQITSFYYPGTTVSTGPKRVKVLISADTSPDVVVGKRSRLRVRSHTRGSGWPVPDNGASRWRLVATTPGHTRVEYRDGTWKLWRKFRGTGSFFAGGRPIRLFYASTSRRYRGRLIAAFPSPGSKDVDTVNRVSMDSYVRGVVPAEMPASWTPAAVQAQAVAARTYAAHEMQHPRAKHYQICDTTACQVYNGFLGEHPKSNAAVKATKRQILTSGGKPAFTQFGSSSGGWTAANQFGYLPAQRDQFDGWAGNANHDWKLDLDVKRIEQAWPAVGNLKRVRVTGRDGNGEWRGRIISMVLIGAKGRVTISGNDFRSRLGLKSTWVSFLDSASQPREAGSRQGGARTAGAGEVATTPWSTIG